MRRKKSYKGIVVVPKGSRNTFELEGLWSNNSLKTMFSFSKYYMFIKGTIEKNNAYLERTIFLPSKLSPFGLFPSCPFSSVCRMLGARWGGRGIDLIIHDVCFYIHDIKLYKFCHVNILNNFSGYINHVVTSIF